MKHPLRCANQNRAFAVGRRDPMSQRPPHPQQRLWRPAMSVPLTSKKSLYDTIWSGWIGVMISCGTMGCARMTRRRSSMRILCD